MSVCACPTNRHTATEGEQFTVLCGPRGPCTTTAAQTGHVAEFLKLAGADPCTVNHVSCSAEFLGSLSLAPSRERNSRPRARQKRAKARARARRAPSHPRPRPTETGRYAGLDKSSLGGLPRCWRRKSSPSRLGREHAFLGHVFRPCSGL